MTSFFTIAITTVHAGIALIKFVVPSIGSIIQVYEEEETFAECSSPTIPSSGKCLSIASRIKSSTDLSASDTKSCGPLSSIFKFAKLLKKFNANDPAS